MNSKPDIQNIVFDLDGTLMSSNSTIYKCTLKTLKDFNIPGELPEEEFNRRIGHHFKDIFDDFQIVIPDLECFIDRYKTYYFDFINESVVYPNVMETLELLRQKNIPVSLLTTKAQDQADRIIDHFGMRSYFTIVTGRQAGVPVKPAPDALLNICSLTGIPPEKTLMVGDSELDIRCGKNAGSYTCGVTFGYRSREALISEQPDYLISDMKELEDIIC